MDFDPFKDCEFVVSELGLIPQGWRVGKLSEIADINPKRSLPKGMPATYIEMSNMPTNGSFPLNWKTKPFAGGMKFQNGDTLLARITPCLENGKAAYINFLSDGEVAFGSTEYIVFGAKHGLPNELLYFLIRNNDFKNYAIKNMSGTTGRQRVSAEVLLNYKMVIPPQKTILEMKDLFIGTMQVIRHNSFENRTLAAIRDTLLPKLMSGEIEIPVAESIIKKRI